MPACSPPNRKSSSDHLTEKLISSEQKTMGSVGTGEDMTADNDATMDFFSDEESLAAAERFYRYNKSVLKEVLVQMPKDWRNANRKDQKAWNRSKNDKCGTVGGVRYRSKTIRERNDIINCHSGAITLRALRLVLEADRIHREGWRQRQP
jgi:hypothetical protein